MPYVTSTCDVVEVSHRAGLCCNVAISVKCVIFSMLSSSNEFQETTRCVRMRECNSDFLSTATVSFDFQLFFSIEISTLDKFKT